MHDIQLNRNHILLCWNDMKEYLLSNRFFFYDDVIVIEIVCRAEPLLLYDLYDITSNTIESFAPMPAEQNINRN